MLHKGVGFKTEEYRLLVISTFQDTRASQLPKETNFPGFVNW